jgi:hypothetical protein
MKESKISPIYSPKNQLFVSFGTAKVINIMLITHQKKSLSLFSLNYFLYICQAIVTEILLVLLTKPLL